MSDDTHSGPRFVPGDGPEANAIQDLAIQIAGIIDGKESGVVFNALARVVAAGVKDHPRHIELVLQMVEAIFLFAHEMRGLDRAANAPANDICEPLTDTKH
jgi:hypothetical protein